MGDDPGVDGSGVNKYLTSPSGGGWGMMTLVSQSGVNNYLMVGRWGMTQVHVVQVLTSSLHLQVEVCRGVMTQV